MSADAHIAARERRIGRALLAAWWKNFAIWIVLLVLLLGSLGLAYLPLGAWNTPLGIGIAVLKAAIVGIYFMSLRRAPSLVLLAVAAGALFVAALFGLTFNDLFTRI